MASNNRSRPTKVTRALLSVFSTVGLGLLICVYLIIGGLIFRALEYQTAVLHSDLVAFQIAAMDEDATAQLWKMTEESNVLNQNDWKRETKNVIRNYRLKLAAYNGFYNRHLQQSLAPLDEDASLLEYILYSLSIITTVGNSNSAPRTQWGKMVAILYAAIGIPLTFMFLHNVGRFLARFLRILARKVCRCGHPEADDRRSAGTPEDESTHIMSPPSKAVVQERRAWWEQPAKRPQSLQEKLRITTLTIVCILLLIAYLIGGALLISEWEGWTFLDSFYHCFTTVMTIGDVATHPEVVAHSPAKIALYAAFVLHGLLLLSITINVTRKSVGQYRKLC